MSPVNAKPLVAPAPTVAALLANRADDPNPGLCFEGQSWSWAEVVAEMRARAAFLRGALSGEPRHVGVLLDNTPEFVFLLGGAALDGAVVVGLNTTRRGDELARDVRHADCRLVLTERTYTPLLDGLDLGVEVVDVDGPDYAAVVDATRSSLPAGPEPTPEDLFLLLFTSGSSGAPKAVRMTQGRAARSAQGRMGFGAGDSLYCAMPLFHGNALNSTILPSFASGSRVVLKRRFSASAVLPDVRAQNCVFFSTIGRALSYILATPETEHDRDHNLMVVLAPESSIVDIEAFTRRFGVPVVSGYGSSENAIVMAPAPGLPKDALGVPVEGQDVAIIDPETGVECPPATFDDDGRLLNGEVAVGEIVGRNALGNFEGYYNNPEADAERSRNGWYWSGDLGYRDANGVFYFAGRTADWLRVDGENFAAAPVERIIERYPATKGVAVYGVPDERTVDDQVMVALEADPNSFDPAAFDAFLAAQRDLSPKWVPRYVRVMERIPVGATNKVDKKPLRAERWRTDDTMFWREQRSGPLARMDSAAVEALHARFVEHGRESALATP